MARLRLRTQLLIATLLIICALLGALLFCVRRTVRSEIAEGVRQSTNASLNAFENVQQEHEMDLSQTAALLAELPTLKAVMATQHAITIQDASEPLWKLAGSQLFVLCRTPSAISDRTVRRTQKRSAPSSAQIISSVAMSSWVRNRRRAMNLLAGPTSPGVGRNYRGRIYSRSRES